MMFAGVPEIDVYELARRLSSEDSFVLLDVRETWELDRAKIADSRLKVAGMTRLSQLGVNALPDDARQTDAEILVLCHHGIRSAQVTRWLLSQGWTNVFSVRGGIAEYAEQVDPAVGKY